MEVDFKSITNKLKVTITEFETTLKLLSQNGKYNTLIVSKDYFKFLENYGLSVKVERGNRAFPVSDHASDVTKTLEKACKNTKLNIPECMIDEYVKDMKARSEAQAKQYNIPFEMFLQFSGVSVEQFEAQCQEEAQRQVKTELVLDKIAEVEGL